MYTTGRQLGADTFKKSLSEALSVFFPTQCLVCGSADQTLCRSCLDSLSPQVQRRVLVDSDPELNPSELVVWAASSYESALRAVLHGFKERGILQLTVPLARLLRASAWSCLRDLAIDEKQNQIFWVPVPSPAANYRKRGFDPLTRLSRRAGIRQAPVLRHMRQVSDQAGLSDEQRSRNLTGAVGVRAGVSLTDKRVVLFDDVVTTGATLLECARVLRSAGAHMLGAVTVASTPKKI